VITERTKLLLQVELRCDPAAPAAVRGSMSSLRGLGWALGDAMLVASELVTGALRRTGLRRDRWLKVRIGRDGGAIAISVDYPEPIVDGRLARANMDELGLMVVDRLTRRWGQDDDYGCRLWAEVPLGRATA
jgi:hypothetical protein